MNKRLKLELALPSRITALGSSLPFQRLCDLVANLRCLPPTAAWLGRAPRGNIEGQGEEFAVAHLREAHRAIARCRDYSLFTIKQYACSMRNRRGSIMIVVQVSLAILGLLMLALWPPASGRILLVPVDGSDANSVLIGASAGDARILGPGALPRSLVVIGNRAQIAAHFHPWSVLMLAPTPSGCGEPSPKAAA
ncbi:hypothetical protein Q5H91_06705 [Sphingomonas sp. KR1UV-12]|uniref:Uncharacterized protein n=1 Tax=Sphingomonas aurea TaxID=3063994 RepID=A0ABT9EJA3_9SPHN|nr:hypothetical protein [Sphingomonas sp. KR1UV-12]MDP1026896.1 hypothetical protein [Sphingomonas sp. KR1UV-12]